MMNLHENENPGSLGVLAFSSQPLSSIARRTLLNNSQIHDGCLVPREREKTIRGKRINCEWWDHNSFLAVESWA